VIASVGTMGTEKNFLVYVANEGNKTAEIKPTYG